jgi:Spy/CpxP family protein refolding chaperone
MRSRWQTEIRLCLGVLCLPITLLLALADPVRGQSPPPFAWWRDVQFQKDLGLTTDQSQRIDGVFRAALPQLRAYRDELEVQEAELSKLIEADSDERAIAKQVDRVEVVRASLNKSRTLMYVHMRQLLTLDQRAKMKILHEQRNRDRRSPQRRDGAK